MDWLPSNFAKLIARDGMPLVRGVKSPRANWAQALRSMAARQDDRPLSRFDRRPTVPQGLELGERAKAAHDIQPHALDAGRQPVE